MNRERNPVKVAIVSESGSVTARGDVLELSATGASIGTHESVAVGPVLRFRLKFPDSADDMEILGRVMWAQDALVLSGRYGARLNVKWLGARMAFDEAQDAENRTDSARSEGRNGGARVRRAG